MGSNDHGGFAPEDIANKNFPTSFRGYDTDKVRDYLKRLSFYLEQTRIVDEDSTEKLDLIQENRDLKQRLEVASAVSLDDDNVFELVGSKTARVLETAESVARERVREAERAAAAITQRSEKDAALKKREADKLLKTAETEAATIVENLTRDAKTQSSRLIADGENKHRRSVEESKRILSEAQERAHMELDSAREDARRLVANAETKREEVLADLVERRRLGYHQLNQLAGARNALANTLSTTNSELTSLLAVLNEKIDLQASVVDVETVESTFEDVEQLVRELDKKRSFKASKVQPYLPDEELVAELEDDTDVVDVDLQRLEDSKPTGDTDRLIHELTEAESDPIDLDEPDEDGTLDVELTKTELPDMVPPPVNTTVTKTATKPVAAAKPKTTQRPDVSPKVAVTPPEPSLFGNAVEGEPLDDLSKELPIASAAGKTADGTVVDTVKSQDYDGPLLGEFVARDVAITRHGPALRRSLRRTLNDDQSDVLNRLKGRKGGRKKSVSAADLPELADQLHHFVEPLETGLLDLTAAGVAAGKGTSTPTDALHHLAVQVAKHMVQHLRAPAVALIESHADEETELLHEPIRDLYRTIRTSVLDRVLEDAISEAFSLGLYSSYAPNSNVRWVPDPRANPAPLCEMNAAVGSTVINDHFPSGHSRPLATPGCRCLVLRAE